MRKKFGQLGGLVHSSSLGFKGLLSVALVLQFIAFLAILLDIQVLRQVVGFFYLSFLPGFIILKIIKLEKIGFLEYILFSCGMSIVILMLFGLISSFLYPALQVLRPLDGFPFIATILGSTLILYFASCRRNGGTSPVNIGSLSERIPRNFKSLNIIPFLVCIPILTIFGVELLVSSGNNVVLLILTIITSAIVLCIFSERIVPRVAYPLVILAVALFLLFHTALVSNYIIGYDVHLEFYLANLTFNKGVWDLTIPHEYNAMLSVTLLPVIYSNFLNLDLNWVFKVIYPLIYSLVPLSLFIAFRKLTNSQIAFLSVFFFMSFSTFYFTMLGLARQMIGELFFSLLILLLVENKISVRKRTFLFIIFGAGLVVSHYATTYLFLFLIMSAFYVSRFIKRPGVERQNLLSGGLVLGCLAMTLVWYVAIAPAPFDALASTFNNIRTGLLSSAAAPGISGLTPSYALNVLRGTSQLLFYGMQLFAVIGLIAALFLYRKMKFDALFLSMAAFSFLVMVLCIVLPSFAAGLVVERFYHFACFLLAPFVVLGILAFYDQISNFTGRLSFSKFRSGLNFRKLSPRIARGRVIQKFRSIQTVDLKVKPAGLVLASLLLILLFLFQVGFIYEVVGNEASSISLSYERISVNPTQNLNFWSAHTPEEDVVGANWLHNHMNSQSNVYADKPSSLRVLASYGLYQTIYFSATYRGGTYAYLLSNESAVLEPNSYVYLRTLNVVYGILEGSNDNWNTTTISPLLSDCNAIYSNGGSQIYKAVT